MCKNYLPTVSCLLILLLPAASGAKDLYVDHATGNDATSYADNGPTSPWATIGRAAWGSTNRAAPNTNQAARAGDRVIVRSGTYSTTGTGIRYLPAYNPANSGTSGSPIVFMAEGTVTLRFSSGAGPVIGAYQRNHITWKGFTINEADAPSVSDMGPVTLVITTGSAVEDSVIIGRGDIQRGDNYTGVRIEWGKDILIRNNLITNFQSGFNSCGVQIYQSGRITIEHNEIHNVGHGIFFKGIEPSEVDWYDVRFNLIYNVNHGISQHISPNTASSPLRVYQNIIRNASGPCLRIWPFGDVREPTNGRFVNNTLYNCGRGLYFGRLITNANHKFWNNVVVNSTTYAIEHEPDPPEPLIKSKFDAEHNLYWGFQTFARVNGAGTTLAAWKSTHNQDAAGPAAINQDPLFVDAAAGDFRLQTLSPARNAGRDMLDLNRNGNVSDLINLGAYVTGVETIGRLQGPPPVPPAPPSGVRVIQ